MKKLIAVLCIGLAVGAVAEVEYGYFATGSDGVDSVSLEAGERVVILASDDVGDTNFRITLPSGRSLVLSKIDLGLSSAQYNFDNGASVVESRTIVGPCMVELAEYTAASYVAYKITRPDAVVNTSPMNIISLPDDNNGDVDLLVESSTDLQNWTPVYSGSAGTSNNAAFFRARLIQN